jgi:soluble cytochrome b562
MTESKILAAVALYRARFETDRVPKRRHPSSSPMQSSDEGLAHCHWMLDDIERFAEQGKLDKAQRWLCFVQGVLWCNHHFTIDEMREHNR